MEDLDMESVGEITDEHDVGAVSAVLSKGDDTWIMDGDVHLDEVERAIGHTLPRGDIGTVAGMIIAQRGALPDEGETVAVEVQPEAAGLIAQAPLRRQLLVGGLRLERQVPAEVTVRSITSVA